MGALRVGPKMDRTWTRFTRDEQRTLMTLWSISRAPLMFGGHLPWNDDFDVSLVNYTPFAILIPLIFGVWYLVSAKDRYQGPVRTLEEDEVTAGL